MLDAALEEGRGLVAGAQSVHDSSDDVDDPELTNRLSDAALIASSVLASQASPDEVGYCTQRSYACYW